MKIVVCSAAEHKYSRLAVDLARSIRSHPEGRSVHLALLDLNLPETDRTALAAVWDQLVTPGWDLAFRARNDDLNTVWHGYRAMTARPFLRDYFPGFDLYIWIDADCWVQQWFAIEWLTQAARRGRLAIVPELDRAYASMYDGGVRSRWQRERYTAGWGEAVGEALCRHPVLNAGVMALEADAPHWDPWAEEFAAALSRFVDFSFDQFSLNYIIYRLGLPVVPLPAPANWLVNLALPKYEIARDLFVEPNPPFSPIGILHLSGTAKNGWHEITDIGGHSRLRSRLTFKPGRKRDMLVTRP
jgi:hypothetical protein